MRVSFRITILHNNFDATNRQFGWLEISFVFDKTNQHTTLFDRYNVELASAVLEKAQVEYITNMYCVANDLEFE